MAQTRPTHDANAPDTGAEQEASPPRVGAEYVARETARAIERGEYEPGQRLREQEIADRFGLSRAPVREALRLLESQGLVVIEPMRGARVVFIDEVSFREMLMIRAGLSGVIAQLAATAPPTALKDQFVREAEQLLDQALDGADAKTVYEGVRAHNRTLSAISPSTRAKSMMRGLGVGREAFQMRALRTKARRIQVARNWLRLARAVQEGDAKTACRTMHTLYDNSSSFLLRDLPSPAGD